MVCTGATAAALAGSHTAAIASTTSNCATLPKAPSPSPSPSSTASAGTNGSKSLGSISSTPNAAVTDLCVTVAAAASSVNSGHAAVYSITVSPQTGTADDVTVQISAFASSGSAPTPVFTVCGAGNGTQVCTLGTLRSGQSSQTQAQITVPGSAATGDTFTLSAKVSGAAPHATSEGSVTGSASTSAIAPKPTPTPTNTSTPPSPGHHHSGSGPHHHSGGGSGSGNGSGTGSGSGTNNSAGSTQNTDPLAGLPPLSTSGSMPSGLNSLGSSNPSGLFPTISPSSGATTAPGTTTNTGSKPKQPYKATTVADVLPLNHGLLSGQVAGLIVLGLGIALIFARVSLRKPKGTENKS